MLIKYKDAKLFMRLIDLYDLLKMSLSEWYMYKKNKSNTLHH